MSPEPKTAPLADDDEGRATCSGKYGSDALDLAKAFGGRLNGPLSDIEMPGTIGVEVAPHFHLQQPLQAPC